MVGINIPSRVINELGLCSNFRDFIGVAVLRSGFHNCAVRNLHGINIPSRAINELGFCSDFREFNRVQYFVRAFIIALCAIYMA